MYILSTLACWAGGLYISSVDFGCFSTVYRDCEALIEREEQTDFTLLILYAYCYPESLLQNTKKIWIMQIFVLKKTILVLFFVFRKMNYSKAVVSAPALSI